MDQRKAAFKEWAREKCFATGGHEAGAWAWAAGCGAWEAIEKLANQGPVGCSNSPFSAVLDVELPLFTKLYAAPPAEEIEVLEIENAKLRELIELIFASTLPYNDGEATFSDKITTKGAELNPGGHEAGAS